jgi:hypothetical protein
MAFVPPTRPTPANYWTNADWWASWPGSVPAPSATFDVQLRSNTRTALGFQGQPHLPIFGLCLPPGYAWFNPVFATSEWWYYLDVWEVPAGSGNWYFASEYFTVAGGFMNSNSQATLIASHFIEGALYSTLAHWPYVPAWNFVTNF